MSVLQALQLAKIDGGQRSVAAVKALDSFNLTVERGEFVGIMGPSGSGKTTLLQLLGTIDGPTSGEILLNGQSLTSLKGDALALFRRRNLGFIFQEFNLLDSLTLRENIVVPLALEGRPAAARALVHQPALILADEPTGNLDSRAARSLMEALERLNGESETTILPVTHDPVSASYCRRILFIKDGRPFTELRRGDDRPAFLQQILDVLSAMGGESYELTYARS